MGRTRAIFAALLLLGVCFIALGASQSQPDSVFARAATICLECIGIG